MIWVRRVAAAAAAAALSLPALLIASATPGWADGLVAVDPRDGAALARGPQVVELTFDRAPDPAMSHVGVVDSSSASINRGEVTLYGPGSLRQRITTAAKGVVVVAYHVVFTDGTETFGSIRFSVGTGIAPPPVAGAAQPAAEATAHIHHHDIDLLSALLLVVDLGVLAGVILLLFLGPKRRTSTSRP